MNVYEEILYVYRRYTGEKRIIGRTCEGRQLFAFFTGEPCAPVCISQYAMHAREYITAYLALEHLRRGVKKGGAWIIPLVNPDGALLSQEGIRSVRTDLRRRFLLRVNGGADFSLWKANAEAVDLNVNFAARWGMGKSNVTSPSGANYIGAKPFCAAESLALKNFTEAVKPQYTISWHTKGEEIYWRFHQPPWRALRDRRLAFTLSESTGYPLKDAKNSAGGYKDWCVERLKIPAFTVEAGKDAYSHPLGEGALEDIIRKNADALGDLSAAYRIGAPNRRRKTEEA